MKKGNVTRGAKARAPGSQEGSRETEFLPPACWDSKATSGPQFPHLSNGAIDLLVLSPSSRVVERVTDQALKKPKQQQQQIIECEIIGRWQCQA